MVGYTKEELKKIINNLSNVEANSKDVNAINKALDFLEALYEEGHIN